MNPYSESAYENTILDLFQQMGYDIVYGPDVVRDYKSPLYEEVLEHQIRVLNPTCSEQVIHEALSKLHNFDLGSLEQKNEVFMEYLQNGIPVQYNEDGENKSTLVYLVDYKNITANSFIVANQWTFIENSEKRPDVLVFLNGLPVCLIELKSPSREETDASEAYRQIRNYIAEIPSMFIYNAICVMSDMAETKAGTITSTEDRYMEWKTTDGNYETTDYADYTTFFNGIFDKNRFLDILKNFICFSNEEQKKIKILAGYHQYFAVHKAIESTQRAVESDGKGGVFWHTQGSGKSLSMVFYAHLLQTALNSPTIVVLTDRNDLDNQLYGQFCKCQKFLRQDPVQATCRQITSHSAEWDIGLKNWLDGRKTNGIIFTTMQKFMESEEPLSPRRNIIVMADEAHRGQYGLAEKVDPKTGKIKVGTARMIRDCLPNATYIGFTGTPISQKDRSTIEVFGNYIDIYDMTQSVKDHATKPVFYESRVIQLKLDEETLKKIDLEYDLMSGEADESVIEKSKRDLSQLEAVLGNDKTIDSLVTDIVDHYEKNREHLLTGKAMVVAYSRPIAMKIYHKILELRPTWGDKVHVVMTSGNNDPEDWRSIIGNKSYKQELATEFKKDESEFKIAIVVDMWLTGFDVPSLATMYVYKPMIGHNLMQAIARVNRVFKEKEGGLIVDYVGIASALKKAMSDYTQRDQEKYGEMDIEKKALPVFLEKLEVCRDLFFGFDYTSFFEGSDAQRSNVIKLGLNFMMAPVNEVKKKTFEKEALALDKAKSLCSSVLDEHKRIESAFFEAVRVLIGRLANSGHGKKISLKEMNDRINELLKQSIQSDGVINLFSDVKKEFSLFDETFLAELKKMPEKNIAIELLKKLLANQISVYRRTNLVKSQLFSEMFQASMNKYINGLITNEEVIDEMLKMARQIIEASKSGNDLGLNNEELAFYDALTRPEAIKDFYSNEELVSLTKELTDTLRKNRTIDWQKREDARAKMRVMIRRLLKKYKYPPEDQANAVDIVMQQCELWTDHTPFETENEPEFSMAAENRSSEFMY